MRFKKNQAGIYSRIPSANERASGKVQQEACYTIATLHLQASNGWGPLSATNRRQLQYSSVLYCTNIIS